MNAVYLSFDLLPGAVPPLHFDDEDFAANFSLLDE
jgi:hypothetical protein